MQNFYTGNSKFKMAKGHLLKIYLTVWFILFLSLLIILLYNIKTKKLIPADEIQKYTNVTNTKVVEFSNQTNILNITTITTTTKCTLDEKLKIEENKIVTSEILPQNVTAKILPQNVTTEIYEKISPGDFIISMEKNSITSNIIQNETKINNSTIDMPQKIQNETKINNSTIDMPQKIQNETKINNSTIDMPQKIQNETKINNSTIDMPQKIQNETKINNSTIDMPQKIQNETKINNSTIDMPQKIQNETKINNSTIDMPQNSTEDDFIISTEKNSITNNIIENETKINDSTIDIILTSPQNFTTSITIYDTTTEINSPSVINSTINNSSELLNDTALKIDFLINEKFTFCDLSYIARYINLEERKKYIGKFCSALILDETFVTLDLISLNNYCDDNIYNRRMKCFLIFSANTAFKILEQEFKLNTRAAGWQDYIDGYTIDYGQNIEQLNDYLDDFNKNQGNLSIKNADIFLRQTGVFNNYYTMIKNLENMIIPKELNILYFEIATTLTYASLDNNDPDDGEYIIEIRKLQKINKEYILKAKQLFSYGTQFALGLQFYKPLGCCNSDYIYVKYEDVIKFSKRMNMSGVCEHSQDVGFDFKMEIARIKNINTHPAFFIINPINYLLQLVKDANIKISRFIIYDYLFEDYENKCKILNYGDSFVNIYTKSNFS